MFSAFPTIVLLVAGVGHSLCQDSTGADLQSDQEEDAKRQAMLDEVKSLLEPLEKWDRDRLKEQCVGNTTPCRAQLIRQNR